MILTIFHCENYIKSIKNCFSNKFWIKLFLCVFCLYGEYAFTEEANIDKSMADLFIRSTCENCEYIKCLNVSKLKCSKYIKKSLIYCPKNKIEGLDIDMPNAACITDYFFELSEVSDALIKKCDKYLNN